MNLADIKDWLIPVSSFIGIILTGVSIWRSTEEYRLKVQAETRLAKSATAETDVRLLELFTEILAIATGRKGQATFSKEILDALIERGVLTDDDFKGDPDKLTEKISKATFMPQVPGAASSEAAFASIATLATRHDVLKDSAIEALESFRNANWNRQLAEKYLDVIRSKNKVE